MIWNSKSLSTALGISIPPGISTGPVKFNSQDIKKGDIFIALTSGARDGHLFVKDAISRGAKIAIISKNISNIDSKYLIKVNDTMHALNRLAQHKRTTSTAKFIAITGSVGKTSTREIIKLMLANYGRTHASTRSFNNFLGLPLTLTAMPDNTEYAIIELGMNATGELSNLTKVVKPDIAIITTISETHIGSFDTIEAITDAKSEIFDGLDQNTGVAVINHDMLTYKKCIHNLQSTGIKNIYTFGYHPDADMRLNNYKLLKNHSIQLNFMHNSKKFRVVMPHLPRHLAFNVTIGFAVLDILKLPIDISLKSLNTFKPLMGRGQIVQVKYYNKTLHIICDYYNSSPQSLKAALQYLYEFNGNNKTAVLGNMNELGNQTHKLHISLMPFIVQSGLSKLFLIGDSMTKLAELLPDNIQVTCYNNVDEMINKGYSFQDNEIILIKGSRSLKLEKLASDLGVLNVL